ncbi:MAG: Do family serine endopeptidase, partial [Sphingomicrobium sp.]
KQRVPVRTQADPLEEFFKRFGMPDQGGGDQGGSGQGGQGGGPRTRETGSLGSGFIISPDGYIVTNNHLIQGVSGTGTVDTVTVTTTDRREYPARIIGRDETSDLALLKVEGRNLPYVQWGDSTKARVGDWIIAIGDPYGVGSTVTAGIVSALHRGITGVGAYDRYIQTDAAINMGNSGGPMFDLNGNVIGINSALISPTGASVGIGLAIPAELAKPVIDALKKGQRPSRGYLGVSLQPVDEDLAPALGIPKDTGELVRSVVPNAPGARAGLVQGDVIVKVNGQPVTPDQTVSYLVANTQVGSRIPLEIIRGGKRATVTVQVAERPTEEQLARISGSGSGTQGGSATAPNSPQRTLGLSLAPLTPELARAANLPPTARGVIVTSIDPNANAAEQGLQRGDLIVSVNNQPVTTPAQVIAAVDAARKAGRSSVLLLVKRGTSPEAFVGVNIGGQ